MALLVFHLQGSMKSSSTKSRLAYVQQTFPAPRAQRAEVRVTINFNRLGLQSEEVEGQTQVVYFGEQMQLHEALRSVLENCLSQWAQADYSTRDAFRREGYEILDRHSREGEKLIIEALGRPLQARAVARVGMMGINFLRTLDKIYEALLRYPLQKSCTTKPTRVDVNLDWSVAGLTEWRTSVDFAFELAARRAHFPDLRTRHVTCFYATDRNVRSQITHKQIANIFLLDERAIADVEHSAHSQLRQGYGVESVEGDDATLNELAFV